MEFNSAFKGLSYCLQFDDTALC